MSSRQSNRMRSVLGRAASGGFTYIEALTAIALFALGGGALFATGFKAVEFVTELAERNRALLQVQEAELLFRKEVRGCRPAYWFQPSVMEHRNEGSRGAFLSVSMTSKGGYFSIEAAGDELLITQGTEGGETVQSEHTVTLPGEVWLEPLFLGSSEIVAGVGMTIVAKGKEYRIEEWFGGVSL